MKKTAKVLLAILLLLLIACAGLLIWQWDNIKALRYGFTMTPEELQIQIDTNQKHLRDTMEQYQIPQEALSEDTVARILSGELTPQDAVAALLGRSLTEGSPLFFVSGAGLAGDGQTSSASSGPTIFGEEESPGADPSEQAEPSEPQSQEALSAAAYDRIQEDIAAMYVLQAVYEEKLDVIVQEAAAAYSAGEGSREEIVAGRMRSISDLEGECDQKVDTILTDLREQLKIVGQDNSLADEVENYYYAEKNIKKAHYIQQFRN